MTIAAAIQMTSTHFVADNLAMAEPLIADAAKQGAKLVVLPEMFALMGMDSLDKIKIREQAGVGDIQNFLSTQAKQHKIWIVGGTIPLIAENPNKARAACLVYDDQGTQIARYDKMHLFDVSIIKGKEEYQESRSIEPGDQVIVIDSPVGKLGLAVCYDLRFPELFRLLFNKGAQVIAIPAAFTVPTGTAHWETLLRARAIENFCYVIAAAEVGTHPNGRKTYGHSMIIDPWGKILNILPDKMGAISAGIDLNHLRELRANIPIENHQKIFFNSK